MFVQLMRFRTKRMADIESLSQDYNDRQDPRGSGPEHLEILQVTNDLDSYIALARFASAEQARENSARPETNRWFQDFSQLLDGPVEFIDTNQVSSMPSKPAAV